MQRINIKVDVKGLEKIEKSTGTISRCLEIIREEISVINKTEIAIDTEMPEEPRDEEV